MIVEKVGFLSVFCVLLLNSNLILSVRDVGVTKEDKTNGTIQHCEELSAKILNRILGGGFNEAFLSVKEPIDNKDDPIKWTDTNRRNTLDEEYYFYISHKPAWDIQWDEIHKISREKRNIVPIGVNLANTSNSKQTNRNGLLKSRSNEPWACEQKVNWEHLTSDYYPAYIRTIECTKSTCYYNLYRCKPNPMQVRILKRIPYACVDGRTLKEYGFTGKYARVWKWIEISVNLCCICATPNIP